MKIIRHQFPPNTKVHSPRPPLVRLSEPPEWQNLPLVPNSQSDLARRSWLGAPVGGGGRASLLVRGCPPQGRGRCRQPRLRACNLSPTEQSFTDGLPHNWGKSSTTIVNALCDSAPLDNALLVKFVEILAFSFSAAFGGFGDSPCPTGTTRGCAGHLVLHTPLWGRPVTRKQRLTTEGETVVVGLVYFGSWKQAQMAVVGRWVVTAMKTDSHQFPQNPKTPKPQNPINRNVDKSILN